MNGDWVERYGFAARINCDGYWEREKISKEGTKNQLPQPIGSLALRIPLSDQELFVGLEYLASGSEQRDQGRDLM
jgi:hypothetical protein